MMCDERLETQFICAYHGRQWRVNVINGRIDYVQCLDVLNCDVYCKGILLKTSSELPTQYSKDCP